MWQKTVHLAHQYRLHILAGLLVLLLLWWLLKRKFMISNITFILPKHPTRRYATRRLDQIGIIIIHHTAGPTTQTPKDIATYHTKPGNHICSDGCAGVGYHYMIDRAGQGYQVNSLHTVSYHVAGHNTTAVGICFIGNYDNILPTEKQLQTCKDIIRMINREVGKELPIMGHRDFADKNCPGAHVDVNAISERAYGVMA